MTANQVAALRAQEEARSNLVNERINFRKAQAEHESNIIKAREAQTNARRADVAQQEALSNRMKAEAAKVDSATKQREVATKEAAEERQGKQFRWQKGTYVADQAIRAFVPSADTIVQAAAKIFG